MAGLLFAVTLWSVAFMTVVNRVLRLTKRYVATHKPSESALARSVSIRRSRGTISYFPSYGVEGCQKRSQMATTVSGSGGILKRPWRGTSTSRSIAH